MEAELRRRGLSDKVQASVSDRYAEFKRTYHNDRAGFVRNCMRFPKGREATPHQFNILERLDREKRVAVRSPHGGGKTALAAWIILHAVLVFEDVKVPTTAGTHRQLEKYLWPEVHKWARLIDWEKVGRPPFTHDELLDRSIKISPTCQAFAVRSDNPELIEGAHANVIVYVFDEAKAIEDGTWDAAEGALMQAGPDTGYEAYALAISTPGDPHGRFFDIHTRKPGLEDWAAVHVTKDELIACGLMSATEAEKKKALWGEASAVYQNKVLGNFATEDETSVIPLAWVEAAIERWRDLKESGTWKPFTLVSTDVADEGEDLTVDAFRYGWAIRDLRSYAKKDTMQTAGRISAMLQAHEGSAVVDGIGVGAGVVHRLREQGLKVVSFIASAKSDSKDISGELGFMNMRSASWWRMRELLDPANDPVVALPPDDMLIGDLTAPKWKMTSGGKVQVESKEDIKKRLKRSTDHGDAVVMAFSEVAEGQSLNVFF